MRNLFFLLSIGCLSLFAACSDEDQPQTYETILQQPSEFDADSWRQHIADSCTRFFDGCNQCRRVPGTMQATCTRKACARYLESKCLDDNSEKTTTQNTTQPKKEDYVCDGNNQFSIYYGSYSIDNQNLELSSEEVMLADRQVLSAYKLTKKMLGSVTIFTDGKLAFQSLGDEAQLTLENELLYTNCKIVL